MGPIAAATARLYLDLHAVQLAAPIELAQAVTGVVLVRITPDALVTGRPSSRTTHAPPVEAAGPA